MSNLTVNKAGDVRINRIEIISSTGDAIDITNQVVSINIFEDLFSPFLNGNLTVLDAVDLTSLLELLGEERININIETPGFDQPIKQQFYLYKMSNKDRFNDTTMVYVIHFMSLEAVVDANRKISKLFKGQYSQIATQLLGKDGLATKKRINIEETSNSGAFISNYWSPAQNLSKAMSSAVSKSGTPNFVFFENREGYIFASLDSLYKTPPIQKFIEDNYTRDILTNGTSARNIGEEYARVRSMYVPEFFNYLDRVQSGFYASSLVSYDIVTKKYQYKVFDAQFKKSMTLNDESLVNRGKNYRSDAMRITLPKYYGNFNGYAEVSGTDNVQERISLLKRAEALKVLITVFGMTQYTVGRTVYLDIYKNVAVSEDDTPNSMKDKVMSGLYLISAIRHNITRTEHTCDMELIKDSILKVNK